MNPEVLKSQIAALADYVFEHVDRIADRQDLSNAFYAAYLRTNSHIVSQVKRIEGGGLLSGLLDLPRGENVVELAPAPTKDEDETGGAA